MELIEVINNRASVRWFTDEPVKEEDLKNILEAAIRAPTAFGAEQWLFIVVKNNEIRRKIHELTLKIHQEYYEKARIKKVEKERLKTLILRFKEGLHLAPIYILVYIDLRERKLEEQYSWLEEELAKQSACAAIENLILTAHNLGYGTCWIGLALLAEKELNKLVNPPENTKLITMISLGKPKSKPQPRTRKPLKEVVKII